MISTYNIWLVLLSVIIALFASYTALDLASRVMHSSGRAMTSWLIGGSVSMGIGIWAMHFIGMLAFHLPIPLAYDIPITLFSLVPAIATSVIALWVIRRGDPGIKILLVSAIVMGVGIAAMHYTGMAALKMQPSIEYDPLLFVLSVTIAIAASLAALKIILLLESYRDSANVIFLKLSSAAVMAVAISGMHYTGMAAADFTPNSMCLSNPYGLRGESMALLIGAGSSIVMLITLLVSIFDERLGDQNARMAEQLRLSNNELQARANELQEAHSQVLQSDKLASIGQLAAGVAHEINNPIGFVYSNLGTLEKYVQDIFSMITLYEQAESAIPDLEVRSSLKAARQKLDFDFLKSDLQALMAESRDGITRVKTIVQNLKDFSHVDTVDKWHMADLHKGLNSTLNIVNNELKHKATVVKEYGDIPEVECLSSQLNQVFMNLLVNASHAIEERGTITLRTGQTGEEVWIEVADSGKGIAPEHMQKIFDPFFTTKPVGEGTGLGLSLSYGIIQKHHGRIEVQSEVGKGTTFRICLPVRQSVTQNTQTQEVATHE